VPRKSAEARGAALFLAGGTPPPPPADLEPAEAKQLWAAITSAFAPDRFDPGNHPLLAAYCETAVYTKDLRRAVANAVIGTPEHAKLHRLLMSATNSLATLASSLRLSVQAAIDRKSGRITERNLLGRPWDDDVFAKLDGPKKRKRGPQTIDEMFSYEIPDDI
jgi:hypothetical protein